MPAIPLWKIVRNRGRWFAGTATYLHRTKELNFVPNYKKPITTYSSRIVAAFPFVSARSLFAHDTICKATLWPCPTANNCSLVFFLFFFFLSFRCLPFSLLPTKRMTKPIEVNRFNTTGESLKGWGCYNPPANRC